MPQQPESRRTRRKAVRKGVETPYEDPPPVDEEAKPSDATQHDAWLKAQKPPHHGG